MKHPTLSLLLLGAVGAMAPACLSRPIEPVDPRTTTTVAFADIQSKVDKIDILLAIDDSGSMADKQAILAVAVPDLVDALVNPPCVDALGQAVSKPANPLEECPIETRREFDPVLDIHIGIISTSLGSKNPGDTICSDDAAHLLNRTADGEQPTFDDKGFLAWSPEAAPLAVGQYADAAALNVDVQKMVVGVGQIGCGYEHVLESWYRFLVDPDPYTTITRVGQRNELSGTDDALLAQRAAFLRPDSLVAIMMLSDENDCSFHAAGTGHMTAPETGKKDGVKGMKARQVCATDPNDPCCAPCGSEAESCPSDPTCSQPLPIENALYNLTCYDQKRRFGLDFLYPLERYVAGITQPQITDRHGEVVDNPLLVSSEGVLRSKDRVFLAGIVGVPWQLIARDTNDLSQGYQNAKQLRDNDIWSAIAGDPAAYVPPTDPHMVESIYPRAGLAGTNAAPGADPIHGHEYDVTVQKQPGIGQPSGDLQYACIFDLPTPIDCVPGQSCDCGDANHATNNPLCQAPDGSYGATQYRAKAYPSLRQLSVLEGVGDQGIVGSICPAQYTNEQADDYGYRPAIGALIERLKEKLSDPCLPRSLTPDPAGQVACIVLEARDLSEAEICSCDYAAGRSSVPAQHQAAVTAALETKVGAASGMDCFCQIDQLAGEELDTCKESLDEEPSVAGAAVDGWCYVDATIANGGNAQLVAHCEATEQRTLRFVGEGKPVNDALVFVTCNESTN